MADGFGGKWKETVMACSKVILCICLQEIWKATK